jgi:uncharacterized membrane protein
MTELLVAVAAFVGTHFLLSHPLRAPIAGRIGEPAFAGFYSLVALATLVWAVMAYRAAPSVQLWLAPPGALHVAYLVMLFACVLLAGSLVAPNPALNMMGGVLAKSTDPKGVMKITRHPMMWAMALWGLVHIIVSGRQETLVLAGGIVILALVGAALQDGKKARQLGAGWSAYAAKTSYLPFARGGGWPGSLPVLLGLVLFALLVWAHPLIIGKSTGLL